MLGNGCMYGYNVPSFITNDYEVSDFFCKTILSLFGFSPKYHKHYKSKVYQWDITKSTVRTSEGNPVKTWLKDNDLWGRKAMDKYIPDWFLEKADEKSICELIAGLIETDGSVYSVKTRNTVSYSTTSYLLGRQILYLFSKIGIIANMDDGYTSVKATTPCYKLSISDSFFIKIFRKKIFLVGRKKNKIDSFDLEKRVSYTANKVSRETTEQISKLITKSRLQIHGNRCATQSTLIKLSKNNDLGTYKWLLNESIYFDKVKSITKVGVVDVFDRSIPKTNNFIVNGIIVHNSGAIEQDADLVVFLHRDFKVGIEVDKDGNSTKNEADLIIAKGRNIETPEIKIGFDPPKMKFFDKDKIYSKKEENPF